jgi:hypothetical protein
MGLRDLVVGFLHADVPLAEIDPYRRAGTDAYDLIDSVPGGTPARGAAWSAFLLKVYADNLLAAATHGRYVKTEEAVFARYLYSLANLWVGEARKCLVSETYTLGYALPQTLPHWQRRVRTDSQLAAMRQTLETGRTRVASDLEAADDPEDDLRVRLAEIDTAATYLDRLWTEKPTLELRYTIGDALTAGLDRVYQLGHLLAQPALRGWFAELDTLRS